MEEYDFDEIIPRKNTNSNKWDNRIYKDIPTEEDIPILSMWIADMDFPCAQPIIRALKERSDHGIFGYTVADDYYYYSVISWMKRKQGWNVYKDWIVISPGIKTVVNYLVETLIPKGSKVILQLPGYFDFRFAIEDNECKVAENNLILDENGYYQIDFEDLEKKASDDKTKMMILCSPHNPIGRIWKKKELERISSICRNNNVLLVSDESFSDIIMPGKSFTPLGNLSEDLYKNSIICTSAGKSFNLSGMRISNTIIPNKFLREKFKRKISNNGVSGVNPFSLDSTQVAYSEGEVWLKQVIEYVYANYNFLKDFCLTRIPEIKVLPMESTYMAWVDFRNIKSVNLYEFFLHQTKIHFDSGEWFGDTGKGFQRVNLACSRYILKEALERIEKILNK